MTSPAAAGDAYQDTGHEPEPTPDQSTLAQDVAAILLVGAAVALTAAAIYALLRRRGIRVSREAVAVATGIASRRTKHRPRMMGRSDVARAQRDSEAFYRAAYIVNASKRIQAEIDKAVAESAVAASRARGDAEVAAHAAAAAALRDASRRERAYELAHERARRRRMEAAVQVAEAANRWGMTLGWHTHRDDRTTPECYAAHGTNFRADVPPVIGWPGTLHGGTCRCRAGRPFRGAVTTDDATGFGPRRTA